MAPPHASSQEGSWSAQRQAALDLYGRAIEAFKTAFRLYDQPTLAAYSPLFKIASEMAEMLRTDAQALLVQTARSTGNYLYAHSVNVAILSLRVGLGLGWEQDQLTALAMIGFLHDVWLADLLRLNESKTAAEDRQEARLHPLDKGSVFGPAELEEVVKRFLAELQAGQYHEAFKRQDDARCIAKIVGLCNTYESMSHYRAWRKPILPYEAVKILMRSDRKEEETLVLKAFLNQLSIYPPGSFVRLSNGEIGRTVHVLPRLPTRPAVEILISADGQRQNPPRVVQLMENPLIHITSAVDPLTLQMSDKRLALFLQGEQWWI